MPLFPPHELMPRRIGWLSPQQENAFTPNFYGQAQPMASTPVNLQTINKPRQPYSLPQQRALYGMGGAVSTLAAPSAKQMGISFTGKPSLPTTISPVAAVSAAQLYSQITGEHPVETIASIPGRIFGFGRGRRGLESYMAEAAQEMGLNIGPTGSPLTLRESILRFRPQLPRSRAQMELQKLTIKKYAPSLMPLYEWHLKRMGSPFTGGSGFPGTPPLEIARDIATAKDVLLKQLGERPQTQLWLRYPKLGPEEQQREFPQGGLAKEEAVYASRETESKKSRERRQHQRGYLDWISRQIRPRAGFEKYYEHGGGFMAEPTSTLEAAEAAYQVAHGREYYPMSPEEIRWYRGTGTGQYWSKPGYLSRAEVSFGQYL